MEKELDKFELIENTVNSITKRDLSSYDTRSLVMVIETLKECLERIDYKVNNGISQENKQGLVGGVGRLVNEI